MKTYKESLHYGDDFLSARGFENSSFDALYLLERATGHTKTMLLSMPDSLIDDSQFQTFKISLERRAKGEPLQYIAGTTSFRFIDVIVQEGVLIPRPETEVLVQCILDDSATKDDEEFLAVDLCTGSGCIACSLAHEDKRFRLVATDISPCAVLLAKKNVASLDLDSRVEVVQCDLGKGIARQLYGHIDYIISNPPYIPSDVMSALPLEVANFEPELALHGGLDGLDIYRRIMDWGVLALKPGGLIAVELHEDCTDKASHIARDLGYVNVEVIRDLTGKDRIIKANLPRRQGV